MGRKSSELYKIIFRYYAVIILEICYIEYVVGIENIKIGESDAKKRK